MDRSLLMCLVALCAAVSCHRPSNRSSWHRTSIAAHPPGVFAHLQEASRAAPDAPILYLSQQKQKRKCPAGGLFSGASAFNYVSFVVGILTLVVNINNNLNNNNNNNNDNNNLDTNNINANQIYIRPSSGRRRRRQSTCNASVRNIFAVGEIDIETILPGFTRRRRKLQTFH